MAPTTTNQPAVRCHLSSKLDILIVLFTIFVTIFIRSDFLFQGVLWQFMLALHYASVGDVQLLSSCVPMDCCPGPGNMFQVDPCSTSKHRRRESKPPCSMSSICSIAKRSWAEVNFIISVQILTNSKNSYKFLLILTNSLNFINCHSPTTTTTPTTKQP